MCRMIAYAGAPVSLSEMLLAPEHGLLRQSWAPRYQTHGVVNADGFGAGWYDPSVRPEPALYRRTQPIWSDESFASVAVLVRTPAFLAAVRSATPGFSLEESATPPFADGRYLFAHNGMIEGWRSDAGAAVRALVSRARAANLRSTVDSEVLFALVLGRLDAGDGASSALAAAVRAVKETAGGRLTSLLTDGSTITGCTFGDTLFVRREADGVVVASEPYDDDAAWQQIPDMSLIEATPDRIEITTL